MSIGRGHLRFALRILVTITALTWFFSTVQLKSLLNRLAHIDWMIVAVACLISSTWIVPSALRWKGISRFCGFPFSLWTSVRVCIIGTFFNSFLPTGNGGDVIRGFMVSREYGYSLGGIWGTILVERMTGLMVSLWLIIITGLILFQKSYMLKGVLFSAAILFVCIVIVCLFLLSVRFRGSIKPILQRVTYRRFHEGARDLVRVMDSCWASPRVMGSAVLFTLANQFIQIVSGFVMSMAILDFHAPFYVFLMVIPLSFISVLLPSIGGYGVRETGFIIFFGWFGIQEEPAAVFGVLRLLYIWFFSLGGAILYILGRKKKGKDKVFSKSNWIG